MASDGAQGNLCQFCGKGFKRRGNWLKHELLCKNKPVVLTQMESPGNAQGQGGIDILDFHVPKQKRTVPAFPATGEVKVDRPPEEETDVLEALLLLKEQPAYPGETAFSGDEPGTGNLDDESAANNPNQLLTTCSDERSSSVECYGGDERRVSMHLNVGVEKDDLTRNVGSQGVTSSIDDSDVIQKLKRKPDLRNLVAMQQQNMNADINIHDHRHPSDNNKLGLNLIPRNDSSDHEVPTFSDSSMDDPNALVPTGTNSDKETKTTNGGVDINIPENRDSSVVQMQNEKLGLNLLPRIDSSDHKVPSLSGSSMYDHHNALLPTDRNSDKETKTVSGGQNVADSFSHYPAQE